MFCGSEIWLMKVQHEVKLDVNEMGMIGWMCGFTLKERKKHTERKELLVGTCQIAEIKEVWTCCKVKTMMMAFGPSKVHRD